MQASRIDTLATIGFAFALSLAGPAYADDAPKHGAPLLGGKVAMTKAYHFEVISARDCVKVYPRTHDDKPVDASKLTGTVIFYHPNSPKPWFERKLTATAAAPGTVVTSLGTTLNLNSVPATGAKVEFKVEGLPDAAEPTASFTVPSHSTTRSTSRSGSRGRPRRTTPPSTRRGCARSAVRDLARWVPRSRYPRRAARSFSAARVASRRSKLTRANSSELRCPPPMRPRRNHNQVHLPKDRDTKDSRFLHHRLSVPPPRPRGGDFVAY